MATNSGIQMDTDTRILALMSYNRNLAESPPGIGISLLHSEGQQPRNPPGKRPSRPTRVRLSGGTVFRYAWRVLAWTALIHVGDIGEAINVTILLLTHDCFQRAGYPKPTMLVQFLEHLPSLHIEISKNVEVIIPHHLLAIQLERDPKNFLRLPWAGFSGNVISPQQLPMAFSVSTARRRDHVCRTCCQAVSTWVEHSKYTQSSHYSSPCPKHWTRPSIYSSAQERIIGIPQATSQKTKIPHDRIQLCILPIRNPSPGTYLTELAIDINRPAGNRTMDQEIAIFWGFQNVLFTLHPLS